MWDNMSKPVCKGQLPIQREIFLSEVNNRETKAAIEANNDIYCFQKWIENSRCENSSDLNW